MPSPRVLAHARHRAAFVLLTAGSVALISASHVFGTPVDAETAEAVADTHDLRPLTASAPVRQVNVNMVAGAVTSGQFEEVVKPTPTPTLVPTIAPTAQPEPEPAAAPPTAKLFERGIASTYGKGDGFEGNRTACGQIFHTATVQLAHKSLPCGTHVKIVESGTDRSVEARVTDRGPYVAGRVVDLSWAALQQLHPNGPGLLQVEVYVLDQ